MRRGDASKDDSTHGDEEDTTLLVEARTRVNRYMVGAFSFCIAVRIGWKSSLEVEDEEKVGA